MITPELIQYVRENLSAGKTKGQIQKDLLFSGGWKTADIDEAFATINGVSYHKKGSRIGSFVTTFLLIIIILGGVSFAAEKFYGPVINAKIASIIGHNSSKKDDQPVISPEANIPDTTENSETNVSNVALGTTSTCADNDMDCLIQAAATCSAATLKNTATINTFGLSQTSTSIYGINKSQNNACIFTLQTQKVNVTTSSGQPVGDPLGVYKKLEGRIGTCSFNKTSDLVTLLKNWQAGNIDTGTVSCALGPDGNKCTTTGGDFANASCTGNYFDNNI